LSALFTLLVALLGAPPAVAWQAPLPRGDAFRLAAAGDSIAVFRAGTLRVIDASSGRQRWAAERLADGPAAVLIEGSTLVAVENDRVVGRELASGKTLFQAKRGPPTSGEIVLLAGVGKGRYAVGVRDVPSEEHEAHFAYVEVVDAMGKPRRIIDGTGTFLAGTAQGERALVATTEGVIAIQPSLRSGKLFAYRGAPFAISVDASRRIHLVVARERDLRLLRLSAEGRRELDAPLTSELWGVFRLVVKGDGTVYVVANRNLAAVDAAGRTRWTCKLDQDMTGGVLAGARLLVAAGDEIHSFDAAGKRSSFFRSPEPIVSAPVLTARGQICVATRNSALCLREGQR